MKRKESEKMEEVTLREAAQMLGHASSSTLGSAIRKGIFTKEEYRVVGKTYLITVAAVERYREEYSGKTGFAAKKSVKPKPKKRFVVEQDAQQNLSINDMKTGELWEFKYVKEAEYPWQLSSKSGRAAFKKKPTFQTLVTNINKFVTGIF